MVMQDTHGYNYVEAAIIRVMSLLDGFDSEGDTPNITRSDYRILRTGIPYALILDPATIQAHNRAQYPRRMRTVWGVSMRVLVRFDEDLVEINTKLRRLRQEIMDHLDRYPDLNSTRGIVLAQVTSGEEPDILQGESNNWWIQRLNVSVEERYTVDIANA